MPEPYYSHLSPTDPTALAAQRLRQQEIDFWESHVPDLETDFELATQRLYSQTGTGQNRISKIFCAFHRLTELPKLESLQRAQCVLDLDRLIAIDTSLNKLGQPLPDVLERIDELLVSYLTPKRANQAPPTKANLKRRLNDIVNAVDDTITLENPQRKPRYEVTPLGDRTSMLTLEGDTLLIASIDKQVRLVAEREEVTQAEALIMVITGKAKPDPNVVINVYKNEDIPNAPAFVPGHGWMTGESLPEGTRRVMDPFMESPRYITPEQIRRFVEGRDGTCRYPGCNRRAEFCQTDHRVNFSDGGPTAPHNLACLCQHHHNIKTDGTANYIMDPWTGDIVWLFDDGTWKTTEPTGPLAPRQKNWAQTFAQAVASRRRFAYDAAHPEQEPDPEPTVEKDDVPPPPF
ncbi:MAG: HNH endonuclease signature motif containing protein [Corynebacterium camporealensis]|uniref:HNH endonuclease signature motif containing protein n=1 Tax=Corynebacterium camporealensis TaxID=161896 RepID=UPI002A91212D|nr:HNH endonuclease signature motif containing protein [Corynebacterium camporealensis]MDY5839887.1 HNH endonuclease signature motif containing protein [Corynebacterium camporealensis]